MDEISLRDTILIATAFDRIMQIQVREPGDRVIAIRTAFDNHIGGDDQLIRSVAAELYPILKQKL